MKLYQNYLILVSLFIQNVCCFYLPSSHISMANKLSRTSTYMALDNFLIDKLQSIKRTFDAITERLADPDIGIKQLLIQY